MGLRQRHKDPTSARSGWGTVLLVAVGAAVAQSFGRFTFGVLLPAVRADLDISRSVAGTLGTINVGAYLLGTILVARATSQYRLIDVLQGGFIFSTVGLSLAAAAPNEWVLGGALFLTGLGGAFIWIPAPAIAADAMPPERRGLAIGLMGAGIGGGIVFSGQLSGFVRSTFGDDAWRGVYTVQASIAVVVLILTAVFLRHEQAQPNSGRAGFGGFDALRRMPAWLPLTLAYTAFGFSYLLVVAFLTSRLEDDSGWTSAESGLAFTVLGVAVIPGGVLIIAIARRIGTGAALAGAFTAWSVLSVMVLPGRFGLTIASSIGLGLVFASIPAVITTYVVENTTPDDYGPSYAAATLAFGIAQMVSPQIGGFVADLTQSFTLVFVLSSAFAALGAIAALQLVNN